MCWLHKFKGNKEIVKYFTLSPLPLETLLPFPRGKGLWRVQNFVPLPLPLPLHTLGPYPQGFVNPWHSLGWRVSRTVTPELRKHVTMGRSHDQTRSDPSHDPPRDWSRDLAPNPASKQSCDKEREHDLMHAYFCRCNLCYVHDRY